MTVLNLTQPPEKFKILLVGDSCIDEYQYGEVDRISPEAPVPIFRHLYSEEKSGMVYNVKLNLEKLSVNVELMTDLPSRKIRLIDKRTNQHVLRVDHDRYSKEPLDFNEKISETFDAVVVSDYDKGFITYNFLEKLPSLFSGPIYVDTKKKNLARIKNCFVKINEQERNQAITLCEDKHLIVTMGSKGACYDGEMFKTNEVLVSDVCGAGDTFLATLVYFHLQTSNIKTAIEFANKAAAVTVQHSGTYAPSMKEYL